MKVGDKVPVNIGGHTVAQAEVREMDSGTATLVVPATLVVMGVRTELTDLPRVEQTTETIITGVDRASGESAPVVEGEQNANQTTQGTTPGVEGTPAVQTQEVNAPVVVPDASGTPATPSGIDEAGNTGTEGTG